jgi:two-component system chemotaxis response regulator CheB
MPKRDVVVIGASAGGVEALRELVSRLPADFPAAVLVVLHVPATGHSALPSILSRVSALTVKQAADHDQIRPGLILVAAPDRHLIACDGRVMLSPGPQENGHRPAVDVLFRSVSRVYGPRVTAIVLSGTLDDGAAGMVSVRLRGGRGIVQDPDDALHPGMPKAAIATALPDFVAPVADIPQILVRLAQEDVDELPGDVPTLLRKEDAMARFDLEELVAPDHPGQPSGLSCPDCNGSLFEIREGHLVRYRCRVGHGWSTASLVAEQSSALESALWMALRSLDEKAELSLRLSQRAEHGGHQFSATSFKSQSDAARSAATVVRDLIVEISRSALSRANLPDDSADLTAAMQGDIGT